MQAHVLATTHAQANLQASPPSRRSITWMRVYPKRGLACAISRIRNRNADWSRARLLQYQPPWENCASRMALRTLTP
jgi:hypothetical protein